MSASDHPHLSVVATSRNDDHGGAPLRRTQIFMDAFFEQCEAHQLRAELILVDSNPPSDRPGLYDALRWHRVNEFVTERVIRVPAEIHGQLPHSERLPLFQMIAKNLGTSFLRRCRTLLRRKKAN